MKPLASGGMFQQNETRFAFAMVVVASWGDDGGVSVAGRGAVTASFLPQSTKSYLRMRCCWPGRLRKAVSPSYEPSGRLPDAPNDTGSREVASL